VESHRFSPIFSKELFMKKVFVIFIFAVAVAGGISAQERGYIKPTFSGGFLSADDVSGAAMSFDLDFVNSFGLTLGLQDLMAWNDLGIINSVGFGAGYTYNARKWSAGGKLLFMPLEILQDGAVGFDVSGTYWLLENLGVTGIMDLAFLTEYDVTIFSMRAGVSLKF
jgi:hypothetical protein